MKRVIPGKRFPVKIWAGELEDEAAKQLENLSGMPFIYRHVAVMPDAHAGKGSTVGTVIATKGAIIPAAVGVDIGCGMCAVKLPFRADALERLPELRSAIESVVPVGHKGNEDVTARVAQQMDELGFPTLQSISLDKAAKQMGSLGGGNHFIEICTDQNGDAWLMLHSGSRNIGKMLAEQHIEKAQDLMKQYFISLPDPDLAYLAQGTPEFKAYLHDLLWAQDYAKRNRATMLGRILERIALHVFGEWRSEEQMTLLRVDCHHNYTGQESHYGQNVWVTRKGAVSARAGQLGIIPGSMGAKSYIVEGLGNEESFCSCSHGAGRRMSRSKARATFSQADLAAQTAGVECRKDADVIDEIPAAYKDIDEVMANQADLVRPLYTLKQILCIKG